MPDPKNSEQNPENSEQNPENSEQNPVPEAEAEFGNRAARRRRGRNRSTAGNTGVDATARDTGRRYMGQGPRQWTVRHGG
jgi:hypothetical protein